MQGLTSTKNSKILKNNQGPTGPIFYFEDVSVEYGEIRALKNVQLSIEKGEVIFLTGASGAGKTTLLKVLAGLVTPTSGKVIRPDYFSGKKKLFISNVFQDLRLMGKYTCEENLMFSYDSTIYDSKAEFVQDMHELARILGIKDRLNLKVGDANGGLKQKVAIIRALLTRPDVLIADEPTSSLDTDNARRLFDVLNLYNAKRGTTVIWATHNKELIKNFTGRIIHLDNGKLVYSGHACFI
jgi:ABC-type multidrug transport system ATPase subunit